jgi:peptidyl-prolyl cis-trans isomerase D
MAVGEPDQATLETYLKDNAQAYEAPEYRGLTLLVLRPEDLVEEIEIEEDELQRTYDSRIDQYRKPEQRRVEQLLAADEAALRRAAELVAGGQSFTEAAAAVPGVERTEVGPLARGDLPAGLDEAAWALAEGGVSQPVQSPFGWHLLRVADIEPEETQPFAAVRDELRRELALERAANELPDLATRLDDELAAGTSLEEAARKVGFEVLKLDRVDRTGHDPSGERLAADRLSSEILGAAFAGVEGETSLLQQTQDGGYFVYHVDSIQPARPRTVDEVREELVAAWKAAEQKKLARAKAEELRGRAASPSDLDQLAVGEPAAQIIPIGPVTRDDQGLLQGLDAAAIAALFATEAGALAEGVVDVPDGTAIIATEEVLPATVEQPLVDATEAAILSGVRNELIAAYEAALRQRFPVTVNQSALAQLMEAQVPDGGP